MTHSEKLVYDGFHQIVEIETTMKGKKVKREKLVINSAVAAIVTDTEGKIGLVTQFRPVVGHHTKEIPAGLLDKEGLSPEEIMLEELQEECGIQRTDILSIERASLAPYYMMVGSSDATLTLYRIHVKTQHNQEVEDADVECVEWVDLATFKRYIDEGLIAEAKSLLAYFLLKEEATI